MGGRRSKKEKARYHVSINDLPTEVLHTIFSRLSCRDLVLTVPYVCTRWREASNCPAVWGKVNLTVMRDDNADELWEIIEKATYLKRLTFQQNFCNYPVIKQFLERYNDLRHIAIPIRRLPHVYVEVILRRYENMEYLSIWLGSFNVRLGINLIAKCKTLHTIVLSGCNHLKEDEVDLKPIADGCPSLVSIDVREIAHSGTDIAYLLSHKNDKLKAIFFNAKSLSSGTILPFGLCRCLQNIQCINTTPQVLEYILSSPTITALGLVDLKLTPLTTLTDFFETRSFPNLSELDLSFYYRINRELAATIKRRLPKISILRLEYCFDLLEPGVEELLKFENLRNLAYSPFMSRYNLAKCFQQLIQCKNLRSLTFRSCDEMTNEIAVELIKNLNVRFLDLTGCWSLTDEFLYMIPESATLEELVLNNCRFSREAVEDISSQKSFVKINLKSYGSRRL